MTLSAADFAFVAALVRRESAIVLGPGKEYLVEARLIPVARQAGAASVSEFLAMIQRNPDPEAQRKIVDALTTNETSWFRDQDPFTALTKHVLPELIQARAASKHIRLWSAACSSGQEPYSMAIALREAMPAGWTYEIFATDISGEMIERAKRGEFTQVEVNRGLPVQKLVHNFERVGAHWRVVPALRSVVTFQRMNIAGPLPNLPPFDVIFLRNVLIYFDLETKRSVLRNVGRLLRPDGWLFLGASETTIGIDDNYERVVAGRASAYRLKSAVPAGTAGKE